MFDMTTDFIDQDESNVTASLLLNAHHKVEGYQDVDDIGEIDNCEICGFGAGWINVGGPDLTNRQDRWGHMTQVSSERVQAWIDCRTRIPVVASVQARDSLHASIRSFEEEAIDLRSRIHALQVEEAQVAEHISSYQRALSALAAIGRVDLAHV